MGKNNEAFIWVRACESWLEDGLLSGARAYYINIMFKAIRGSRADVLAQMKHSISSEFYGRLCTRFTRTPRRQSERNKLPRAWLFPDVPAFKRDRASLQQVRTNFGLHYNGFLLLPSCSRYEGRLEDLVERLQFFRGKFIERVDVEEIDERRAQVSDYAIKSLKWKRVSADDIILLPRSTSELVVAPSPAGDEEARLKDFASKSNFSEELALRSVKG